MPFDVPVRPLQTKGYGLADEVSVTFDEAMVSEGNVYIFVNGKEFGSLFFEDEGDGKIAITLGQFRQETQSWEEANPVYAVPEESND